MITEPTALLAFMFLLVAFARFLEGRFAFVQKVSSAVVCTRLGILLANIGVIPHDSAVLAGVSTYAVPYAIVLAGASTFVGAVVARFAFASSLGPETWKLAGTFAGAFGVAA